MTGIAVVGAAETTELGKIPKSRARPARLPRLPLSNHSLNMTCPLLTILAHLFDPDPRHVPATERTRYP